MWYVQIGSAGFAGDFVKDQRFRKNLDFYYANSPGCRMAAGKTQSSGAGHSPGWLGIAGRDLDNCALMIFFTCPSEVGHIKRKLNNMFFPANRLQAEHGNIGG